MTDRVQGRMLDDDDDEPSVLVAVPSAIIRLIIAALGLARPAIVLIVLVAAVAGCGRKGGLEVPGAASGVSNGVSGTEATLAVSRGLEPQARLGDTVVADPPVAPELRRARGADAARVRAADIRGPNADAPEAGDAVPEGPTVGIPPRRPFILDPLL